MEMSIMKIFTFHWKLYLVLFILDISLIVGSVSRNKLLLVAFDGFRYDYLKYMDTPNFDQVLTAGTRTAYLNGVYPSTTLPSLYSIATGLYPESHGIINNDMYDPNLNASFNYTITNSVWYEEATPIWVTAKKQGLKTAGYYFPGIDAEIHGYRPDFWIPFNISTNFNDKVDQVITWFTKDNVDFVILYFPQPDHTAHQTGPAPESNNTLQMIKYCDSTLGYLLSEFEAYDLANNINIIILSDHGFTSIYPNHTIDIYDYVDPNDIQIVADNNVLPVEGKIEKVYNIFKNVSNLTVYLKEDIPDRFHYKHNDRIMPIVLMPDEGYRLVHNASTAKVLKGTHGFDNNLMSMKPFFTAIGPDIKEGYESPVFSQLDVYPLMCKLLGITPEPNNGSLEITGKMLITTTVTEESNMNSIVLVAITTFSVLLCVLVIGIVYLVIRQRIYLNSDEITYTKVPTDYISL